MKTIYMRIFCEKYVLDWITAGKAWSLQGQIYLSLFKPIVLYDYNEVTLFSKNLFFLLDIKYLVVPNDCIYITMKTRIINVTKNKTFELHGYRLSSRMIVLNASFIQNLSIFLVIAHGLQVITRSVRFVLCKLHLMSKSEMFVKLNMSNILPQNPPKFVQSVT